MISRRQFLSSSLAGALSWLASGPASFAGTLSRSESISLMKRFRIVDAHAHMFTRPDVKEWLETGMAASAFAAVGDRIYLARRKIGTPRQDTLDQLDSIRGLAKAGFVKPVLRTADIPESLSEGQVPGAILSIEGGDALEGKVEAVAGFYDLGVRIITIVHYVVNELGDIMTAPPRHNGLTRAGISVVEKMQSLGMVVDVAHAHTETLKHVVAITGKPVIDSHTSLCRDDGRCGRSRTWKEMELVAGTGGLVGTWPLSYGGRKTFRDWAREILEMKQRLGVAHIGLGTDDGGKLPRMVSGYRDTRDLGHLIKAMEEVDLSRDDISAFLGGNLVRVLRECIG
jgi:microsomal dipeptidase-like Zn-dependent dipeptidase